MTISAVDAWPELSGLIDASSVDVLVRPPHADSATASLLELSAHSYLGALAMNTSGLVVDSGWLRILGGTSSDGYPGLDEANADAHGLLVVAFDALGGAFALDGGALGRRDGSVHHFSVESLRWENLETTHSAFVTAMLGGATVGFHNSLRWPGWETEIQALLPGHGMSLYPPPFTKEGKDCWAASRRAVPFRELIGVHNDYVRQLDGPEKPAVPMPIWSA